MFYFPFKKIISSLKLIGLPIVVSIFLFACQITNPITITEQWLNLSNQSQFEEATAMMVEIIDGQITLLSTDKKQAYQDYFTQTYLNVETIDVNNMVPLPKTEIETLGVDQGYTVYFSLTPKQRPQQDLQVTVIWWENQWKIVYKIPFS